MTALDQTAPLSAERLAEIREYEQKATPGPWTARHGITPEARWHVGYAEVGCSVGPRWVAVSQPYKVETADGLIPNPHSAHDDAEFIAHARQDVADLLVDVDRLKAEYAKAIDTVRHTAEAMVKVGTVMENAVRTAADLGAGAGMDALIGYLSDAGMLPADVLAGLAAADHKMTAADQERADLAAERDALADHLAEIADRLGIPATPGQKPVVRWVAALEAVTALTATGVS